MDEIQNTDNTNTWRECAATDINLMLVGMQSGKVILEDSLTVSYKTKHTPII